MFESRVDLTGSHSSTTAIEVAAASASPTTTTQITSVELSTITSRSYDTIDDRADGATHMASPPTHSVTVAPTSTSMREKTPAQRAYSLYALPPRRNGLQRPFHQQQLLVWFASCVSLIVFFGLVLPFAREDELYACIGIYFGLACLTIPTYVWTQHIDPALRANDSHPVVHTHANHHHPSSSSSSAKMCDKCTLWQGQRTKHCHICRKCIDGFDHHCLYLNTCIGKHNYKQFLGTLLGTSILLGFQIGITLSILIRAGRHDQVWIEQVDDSALNGTTTYVILLCIGSIIPFIFWLLILSLLSFHIYISILNQTTYEWILRRRRVDSDRAADRAAAMQSARPKAISQSQANVEAEWLRARELDRKRRAAANVTTNGAYRATAPAAPPALASSSSIHSSSTSRATMVTRTMIQIVEEHPPTHQHSSQDEEKDKTHSERFETNIVSEVALSAVVVEVTQSEPNTAQPANSVAAAASAASDARHLSADARMAHASVNPLLTPILDLFLHPADPSGGGTITEEAEEEEEGVDLPLPPYLMKQDEQNENEVERDSDAQE